MELNYYQLYYQKNRERIRNQQQIYRERKLGNTKAIQIRITREQDRVLNSLMNLHGFNCISKFIRWCIFENSVGIQKLIEEIHKNVVIKK